jgi:hypothetical protein
MPYSTDLMREKDIVSKIMTGDLRRLKILARGLRGSTDSYLLMAIYDL